MAALIDIRRATQGQPPDLQAEGFPQTTTPGKAWNPLLVPAELYVREGLAWQPHQPVSLTVEVNGKRDLVKYAAVMQLVPKLGFVARLGQPGAAAKFQNLHLIDVKRRGSTDIHICLGDLAWARSRASEASVAAALVPVTAPSSGAASPDISDTGMVAPEGCVLSGGAAEGGLLSGSSSEGTTAVQAGARSSPAAGTEADAGASTDSRSHGGVTSDHDEKATGTSAVGCSADAQTSCSAAVANAPLAANPAAAAAAAAGSVSAADAPASSSLATTLSFRCSCALCPCHVDPDQLDTAAPGDAPPHGFVMGGRQMSFGRSSTSASGHWAGGAGLAGSAPNSRQPSPGNTAAPAGLPSAACGPVPHLSRERLRDLCLPGLMKSASLVGVQKAKASGPGDGGRATGLALLPFLTSASLPPLRGGQGSISASVAAGNGGSGAVPSAGPGGAVAGGDLIDRELVLPPALAAKRMADTHVLVQYEIDGEAEDCRLQYRLVQSDDGRTLALQGISLPLRGLQLLSLSEAPDGDLFIRAATPSAAAPSGLPVSAAPAPAAAAAAAAPPAAAVAQTAAAAVDTAPVLSRASSGRQRRPSLKVREGAEDAAATGAVRTWLAGNALASRKPLQSAAGVPLAGMPLSALQRVQGQKQQTHQPPRQQHLPLIAHQSAQQTKRRGRPPKPQMPATVLPPTAAVSLQRYQQQLMQLQQQQELLHHQLQRSAQQRQSASADTGCDDEMGEQVQYGHNSQAPGCGGSAKRSRTASGAGCGPSSRASEDGTSAWEEHIAAPPEGRRIAQQRARRAPAPVTTPFTAAPLPAIGSVVDGGVAIPAMVPARARMHSKPSSAASLPPLSSRVESQLHPREKVLAHTDGDEELYEEASDGSRALQQKPLKRPRQQKPQPPPPGHVGAARVSSAYIPFVSGRVGRKRYYSAAADPAAVAAAAAAAAPAVAGLAQPAVKAPPSPKRVRTSPRYSSQGDAHAGEGGCDIQQPQQQRQTQRQQSQQESPQGSEAAAAAGPPLASGRNTRAARRAVQPPPPSSSSCSDYSTDSDEADGREQAAGDAGAAGGGAGAAGVSSSQAAASQQVGAAAAAPRHRHRSRQNAGKFKPSKPNRHPSKISNVIRNAGAIVLMIGRAPMIYEKQLRATFGNNPDTSKALRLLEEQGKVMRLGMGYRMHPYHYTLTPVGRKEYDRLLEEKGPSHAWALNMGVRLPMSLEDARAVPGGARAADDDEADAGEAGASAAVGEGAEAGAEAETEAQSGEVPAAAAVAEVDAAAGVTAGQQPKQEPVKQPMAAPGSCEPKAALAGGGAGPSTMQVELPASGAAAALAAQPHSVGVGSQPSCTCESGCQQLGIQTAPLPQLSTATGAQGGGAAGAAAAAGGWCAAGSSSPSASTHSVQQVHQAVAGSAAAPEATWGLIPTTGSSAGTPATATVEPQRPQHLLLLQIQHHAHDMAAAADQRQFPAAAAAASAGSAAALAGAAAAPAQASTAAVAAAAAAVPPGGSQQMQAVYACPVGYQLAYPQGYQLAPQQDAGKSVQESVAQLPYGNPYVYGYVPTPFGYMPCAMYSTYAPADAGAAAGGGAAAGVAQPQMVAAAGPVASAPPSAQHPAVVPAGACGAAFMQSFAGTAFPTGNQPTLVAGATTAAAGTPASMTHSLQTQLPEQILLQQHTQVPAATPAQHALAEAQAQPTPLMSGVPIVVPPLLSPQQQPQQQQTSSSAASTLQPPPQLPQQHTPFYRYVVEMTGSGSWRAEVPSADGKVYYSPSFASSMQAAAAADLLMSKLRPGEQLNLGINPQEEATLSSLTVEQVQAMLWGMAQRR